MASAATGTKVEKPSFAKVAAAGLKLSSVQPTSTAAEGLTKSAASSSPRDGANSVSPSSKPHHLASTPKQKTLVAIAPLSPKEPAGLVRSEPGLHMQTSGAASRNTLPRTLDGMLTVGAADESATQISSSLDSAKPASLDGKSVASGTTFTLDEKESLRPDDSASVMAREDEEGSTRRGHGLQDASSGSDEERQAFCDQLREISDMDTTRQPGHRHGFTHNGNAVHGVLYVPPLGPGVGTVPGSLHTPTEASQGIDQPPDPKLLEALDSPKDRIMVLKLEQDIVDFVKDPKESSLKLPQTNAFYRMLAHKLADYYMLGHVVDDSTMAVRIYKTPNCRLPPPLTGIATLSTAASTPPPTGPQMKILRRGVDNTGPTIANGSSFTSKTTSENGESGNEEERKSRLPASREEREARYEAARKRIMGSEQPATSPEDAIDKDNSRSSSAAGKRSNRKKQRSDSEDGFEARSAYSAYYPTAMTPSASASGTYGLASAIQTPAGPFAPPSYGTQMIPGAYQQYSNHPSHAWANSTYYSHNTAPNWPQPQQNGYDLTRDFQQTMSFQSPNTAIQSPSVQQPYGVSYNQQMGTPQQSWAQQQHPYMTSYAQQPSPSYAQSYPSQPPQAANHFQDAQPYAYGQLPSQAFPGRPPSKLEHPLPGSYKGKHFNPQSQSFIPGQANSASVAQYPVSNTPMHSYSAGLSLPANPQRPDAATPQHASFGLVQHIGSVAAPARLPGQPLLHPLPQPVFPQQPSPSLPLPAKPVTTPAPKPTDKSNNIAPAIVSSSLTTQHSQNTTTTTAAPATAAAPATTSIAKWGAPASLPAKPPPPQQQALPPPPPPSAELYDPARFAAQQAQRQPGASARVPNGLPTFGSMPPASAGYGMSGPNVPARRM